MQSNNYWSSTSYANNTSNAWIVNMNDGNVNANDKSNNNYVDNNYVDNNTNLLLSFHPFLSFLRKQESIPGIHRSQEELE